MTNKGLKFLCLSFFHSALPDTLSNSAWYTVEDGLNDARNFFNRMMGKGDEAGDVGKIPTEGIGNIPTWKGSGPAPGVLGVNSASNSVGAIKNYYPKEGIEFVFDPKTNTFAVGKPQSNLFTGSAHQQLAKSINADESTVLGGTFKRGPNGEIYTNENSGHYGERWNDQLRAQFQNVMEDYGLPVTHEKWNGGK